MEVTAEELEYTLNVVLQKSKCHSHRDKGSLGRKGGLTVRALPSSAPQSIRPVTCTQTVETIVIAYFLPAKVVWVSGRVFHRLFYREVSGEDKDHCTSCVCALCFFADVNVCTHVCVACAVHVCIYACVMHVYMCFHVCVYVCVCMCSYVCV